MMRKMLFLWSLLCTALCVQVVPAIAATYPSNPIQIVVPFPPGGGTDLFARVLAQAMSESMGTSVVVLNRSGAQGNVGLASVARAPADGYTIGLAEVGNITVNPWMYKQAGFDPIKDFTPLGIGVVYPNVVVVSASVQATNLKELAALAKEKSLTFASGSAASQLAGELFKIVADVNMLHVPYKGAGPAQVDISAGRVDVTCITAASAMQLLQGGRTRAIAVTGPERIPALPDVMTASESGYPDFEMVGWYGLVAPAGTPKDIVAKLNAEIRKALEQPSVREKLESAGLDPKPGSPQEMATLLQSEYERWGEVVKTVGIKPE